jgi:hypothetical protein
MHGIRHRFFANFVDRPHGGRQECEAPEDGWGARLHGVRDDDVHHRLHVDDRCSTRSPHGNGSGFARFSRCGINT